MADEFEPRFSGLDGERPLPPGVRERLEAALLAAAAGEALPVSARETAAPVAEGPPPLDGPRPLPPHLRSRLEDALLGRRTAARARAPFVPALLAVAVLVVLVGSVGLLREVGSRSGGREVTAAGPTSSSVPAPEGTQGPASPESPAAQADGEGHEITSTSTAPADRLGPRSARPSGPSAAVNPPGGPGGSAGRDPGAPANPTPAPPSPAATTDSGNGTGRTEPGAEPGNGNAKNATGTEGGDPGPPPPYAFSAAPAATSTADSSPGQASAQPGRTGSAEPAPAAPQPSASASPPASSGGPAFRLGLVGGDPAQEAGFRAYVDLLNRTGGVRGRPVELVPTGPESPASGTLATVNLSSRPIATAGNAPKWAGGPVLETLTATEDLLTGRVFSFASPPERQGHLVADAVFPEHAPGATAVIYRALDGPLAGAVPRAMEAVLAKRGVRVVIVAYDPAKPPPLVPADAAFLSLDTATAKAWLGQARQSGYSTRRGVAGIYSLFDQAALPDLPEGARVVSPYVVPAGDEGEAIRSGAGAPSAAVLHGWATAKSLAVALWRSGAGTPDAMQTAVENLAGYDSGLAPPYETRPNSRSRTPEGVLYEARSGAFTIQGGFRRDPH